MSCCFFSENVGLFLFFTFGAFQKVEVRIKMLEFKTPTLDFKYGKNKTLKNLICYHKA